MDIQATPQRAESEKRLRYEEVVQQIREKYGSLEEMRKRLNFSQKQMSELLLVDPSAWTRWVKDGEAAPAHIYQALAWYFESRIENISAPKSDMIPATLEKLPWQMAKTEIIEKAPQLNQPVFDSEVWAEEKAQLASELRNAQNKAIGVSDGWKLFLIINTVLLLYFILF